MKVLILLIILLLVIGTLLCLNAKFRVDNFSMDLSCEAVQNKYYHPEELEAKMHCPNLVIVEKNINGRPAFFAEFGDHKGPYFSSDYVRYYHMGMSPEGIPLNLEYDLYYYPLWNPRRWFYGRNVYYPRRRYHWEDDWKRPWNRYNRRINRKRNYDWNYDKKYYREHDRDHNRDRDRNRDRVPTPIRKNKSQSIPKSSSITRPISPKRSKNLGNSSGTISGIRGGGGGASARLS